MTIPWLHQKSINWLKKKKSHVVTISWYRTWIQFPNIIKWIFQIIYPPIKIYSKPHCYHFSATNVVTTIPHVISTKSTIESVHCTVNSKHTIQMLTHDINQLINCDLDQWAWYHPINLPIKCQITGLLGHDLLYHGSIIYQPCTP